MTRIGSVGAEYALGLWIRLWIPKEGVLALFCAGKLARQGGLDHH